MTDELKTFIDKYKAIEAEIKLLQEDKKNLIDDLRIIWLRLGNSGTHRKYSYPFVELTTH